jgi:SAM-dependent methyltransferase
MSEYTNRLYSDLAWLWPLWGSPGGDYAEYCDFIVHLIKQYAHRETHSLLNVGCGGGKNVFNLKRHFTVTGLDLSLAMLDLARDLNPECRFVRGDMRTYALGEQFDTILIDDAVSYMTTAADLRSVFERAYAHLAPGGVMITGPDNTKETFQQNRTRVSYADPAAKPENVDVVFIENDYDPDPGDDTYEGTMIYLIRRDGELCIEHDLHLLGLFSLDLWRELLLDVGFALYRERYTEGVQEYVEFVCVKPI